MAAISSASFPYTALLKSIKGNQSGKILLNISFAFGREENKISKRPLQHSHYSLARTESCEDT